MARAERYVAYQIETLLKPLVDLAAADVLTGTARGIAFRLVENFGLINRRDVADEVRSLDEDARAALRRLGVGFGAYHIFVPGLLKPAPAGLLTLLWALKNDARDRPGFGDVVHLLASGRTSVVVDGTFEKSFYRLAGYRTLGRRAVRIDILERLADLIRPAVGWRQGSGPRPEGGYGDNAFIVTPAMMSILGATSEDMEEILKGLGYRGEAKPAADVAARIADFDAAARPEQAARNAAEPDTGGESADPGIAPTALKEEPGTDEAGPADEPVRPAGVETDGADEDADRPVAGPDLTTEPPAPDPANQSHGDLMADTNVPPAPATEARPLPEDASAAEAPIEEPKPVMIWRQARFDRNQRHGGPRQGQRHARPGGRQDSGAEGEQRPRFDRKGKPGMRDERPDGAERSFKGKRPPRDGGKQESFQQSARDERPARIDPDAPFAKLAALRDQLKKYMADGARQRIDKWLFFARVVKSRSLAAKLVEAEAVRVNRDKVGQPSHQLKAGDVLTIKLGARVLVYRVLAPGSRRGPPAEARMLYEDLNAGPGASALAVSSGQPGSGGRGDAGG